MVESVAVEQGPSVNNGCLLVSRQVEDRRNREYRDIGKANGVRILSIERRMKRWSERRCGFARCASSEGGSKKG